jgi:hypothetical protein
MDPTCIDIELNNTYSGYSMSAASKLQHSTQLFSKLFAAAVLLPCALQVQAARAPREVRADVKKYPYLLLSTLDDWQSCTGNPGQEAAGFPCLQVNRTNTELH